MNLRFDQFAMVQKEKYSADRACDIDSNINDVSFGRSNTVYYNFKVPIERSAQLQSPILDLVIEAISVRLSEYLGAGQSLSVSAGFVGINLNIVEVGIAIDGISS